MSTRTKKILIRIGLVLALLILIIFCFRIWIYHRTIHYFCADSENGIVFSDTSLMTTQEDGTVQYQDSTYTAKENIYTVLFIGIDRSEFRLETGYATEALSLADTLIVASIDLSTCEIMLLNIPRDTMTTIYTHSREGEHKGYLEGQIATQYAYGGDDDDLRNQHTLESVERLLNGLQIDAYATIDMDGIIEIADMLDGIPITVPDDEYYCGYTGYTPGQNIVLRGEAALQFVQYRDTSVFASNEMRIELQKVFLKAAIKRLYITMFKKPLQATNMIETIYEIVDTDISAETWTLLLPNLLFLDMDQISMCTLPGEAVDTDVYEEYYCDTDALDALLLEIYFEQQQ